MSQSLIGGMPYAGRFWVWTNTESMKESEDLESTRDFKIIFGRVSEVRKRVSESGFERADALRVRVFTRGSSMQILKSCRVSRTAQSFFKSVPEDMNFHDQTWMLGLWQKPSWIFNSPRRCVQQCHKRGKACCQDGAVAPVELAFNLSQVLMKGQEWWTSSVQKLSPCAG